MKLFFQRNDAIPEYSYLFTFANKYWFNKLNELKEHPNVFAVIVFRHKENEAGLSVEIL